MKKRFYRCLCLFLCLWCINFAQAQEMYTLSGYMRDANTGEELISANLFVKSLAVGSASNLYGYYAINLPPGEHEVTFSYLGYTSAIKTVYLDKDLRLDIDLDDGSNTLTEITITAEEVDKNVSSVEMSTVDLSVKAIKKMPALLGEVDIIKAIQLLPGVKALAEGTSGFYVRGGNADQNLILLDEAPIYNASHMLGFFSSFNPDAIKDMQLYKGAISSRYGGRLSSVLDIRMKEGNNKKFSGSTGIGLIMSRLSLEAPLGEKGSFIVSGRRSYLDVIAKTYFALAKGQENNGSKFYFYDLNAKGNYKLNENNRLFISAYLGRDVIAIPDEGFGIEWGNKTSTFRWNRIFSPTLFSNFTFYFSQYDYSLKSEEGLDEFKWASKLEEWSGKVDFTHYLNQNQTLYFGAQSIIHDLSPGNIEILESGKVAGSLDIEKARTLENAVYISDEISFTDRIKVEAGIRGSSLHNLGPKTHYVVDSESIFTDSTKYEKGIYHSYYNLEPRLGINYKVNDEIALKASYNRTNQYIQQASNGNTSTPFDIWFTASPEVKPQQADQYAIGYFQNFKENTYELSVEAYYKNFTNAIDFKERASLLLNKNLEGELRIGQARAYGLEFMIKKDLGKWTGWVSYTLSKIEKQINSINAGNWYNAKYDKPQDLSVVLSYDWSKRLTLSGNFVYSSGGAVTFPTGRYTFLGSVVPVYSDRNAERLPNYHRMDMSATLRGKKKFLGVFDTEWVFSIYNVYNRKNAFAINFKQDEINTTQTYAEKRSVFSIVPAVTYNAKF